MYDVSNRKASQPIEWQTNIEIKAGGKDFFLFFIFFFLTQEGFQGFETFSIISRCNQGFQKFPDIH